MLPAVSVPLIRLGSLFPDRQVYAQCEFLAPSGCFKIRGAVHLLEQLSRTGGSRELVVPSMGNTALGAAVGARAYGFRMVGVVPETITRDKDEKLQVLGVELVKIAGGGCELLGRARQLAAERDAYFVHPHLDPLWTDGYQAIAAEILRALPDCKTLVFPVGGGGLLMGLTAYLKEHPRPIKLVGCEAFNYPTYAQYSHARSATIADGLMLDEPHPQVQQEINARRIDLHLVKEEEIRAALRALYTQHALVVEPSSAITVAVVQAQLETLDEPVCVVLTGGNIGGADFDRLIAEEGG